MERHGYNIFPEMNDEDYSRLLLDIKVNGYDRSQPIYLYEGKILDGWNRQRACNELNIKPEYKEFVGLQFEAIQFVMRTNKRRNLTSSQWAAIAAEADELWDILLKQVEEERRRKISERESKGNQYMQVEATQKIAESPKPRIETRQKIAESFNTNRTYVSDAKKYRESNPEVFESIKSGQKSIAEVKKEEKIQKRKDEIEEIKKNIETESTIITGTFDILVVDPPWSYGRGYDPDGSRVANPYPEMTQEQLKSIDIPAKDNCIMWLWTTHAFMMDARELLEYWGFAYKATLVWDKEKIGMGAWLRMQCEFCLLGIKGKPVWDVRILRDIIREPRREHSRKPDMFYKMIDDNLVGSKLDYFSRQQRDGWHVYGAESNKF